MKKLQNGEFEMEQANSEGVITPDIYLKPTPLPKCKCGKDVTYLVFIEDEAFKMDETYNLPGKGRWMFRCEECANEETEKR